MRRRSVLRRAASRTGSRAPRAEGAAPGATAPGPRAFGTCATAVEAGGEAPTVSIEWREEKVDAPIIEDLSLGRRQLAALENPIHAAFHRFLRFTGLSRASVGDQLGRSRSLRRKRRGRLPKPAPKAPPCRLSLAARRLPMMARSGSHQLLLSQACGGGGAAAPAGRIPPKPTLIRKLTPQAKRCRESGSGDLQSCLAFALRAA